MSEGNKGIIKKKVPENSHNLQEILASPASVLTSVFFLWKMKRKLVYTGTGIIKVHFHHDFTQKNVTEKYNF